MSYTVETSVGPVVLKHMWDGFRKGVELGKGPFVEMSFLAPSWDVTDATVNALMGVGRTSIAQPCPVSSNLSCLSAWVEGRGEIEDYAGNPPAYNLPIIRATYGLRSWEQQVSDDPTGAMSFPNEITPGQPFVYATQRIDYSSEALIIPQTAYHYEDGTPSTTPYVRKVGVASLIFTKKFQSKLPTTLILSLQNKLNKNTFFGASEGQIRFDGARTMKDFLSDGTRTQEIELLFRWREYDWNMVPRPDSANWSKLIDNGGSTPYLYAGEFDGEPDLHALLV